MTEDRFDELIRSAARDYNRPGEVPRERMWERVQAARTADGAGAQRTTPRTLGRHPWLWGTLAAAALLTIGVGIGRWMERTSPGRPAVVAATTPATRGATPDERGGVAPGEAAPDGAGRTEGSAGRTERTAPEVAARTEGGGRSAVSPAKRVEVASTRGAGRPTDSGSTASSDERTDAAALAYRAVVLQHLAGTEAMLTSFRDVARSGSTHVDPQLASWARDQLATTRMLQASARSDDPTMKRLLDDLELVLTQIAQYTAGDRHRAEDARLIEQAIERHSVITRLRTIPASVVSPGT